MPTDSHRDRRDAIAALLSRGPIAKQDALVKALHAQGFAATQSSVSRDLKDLGAIKTAAGYELPGTPQTADNEFAGVGDLLRTLTSAGPNLLVIKTATGAAQRVALALESQRLARHRRHGRRRRHRVCCDGECPRPATTR